MKISNLGLQAFMATAQTLNITMAAKVLGLTQSALSQRIALLENDLETTLFIRETKGLRLTEAGDKLLRFSQLNQKMEEELLLDLKGNENILAGTIRLAAYSSILRSVIIPALAPFLQKHTNIQVSFQSYEMGELEKVLQTAGADIIFTDYLWEKKGVHKTFLGHEEFVAIESKKINSPDGLYLDHGPDDNATIDFFQKQSKPPKYLRRSFMGDVYGIIDGVEKGLGRAVMSKHLVADNKKISVLKMHSGIKRPVMMYYFESPYYSRAMTKLVLELEKEAGKYL